MAEFKAGDRVVKMSGIGSGKYGTVNSVMENGTLNVTFDGEKIPRFCDPMRCGQVARNAKFKVGDRFAPKDDLGMTLVVKKIVKHPTWGVVYAVDARGENWYTEDEMVARNSRAANAVEFTNPNYRPEAGMRFLDENFSMFDPKVAKAMIEDARKKGVKVPPGVVEKARKAGLIANAARNAKFKAANAAPKGLMPTTKLRLKEDFSDEYGSYKKGSVFPMYAMGGINPKFGTMVVPGRGVTLQIPWEKLEVVNACARNADPKAYDHSGRLVKVGDTLETRKGLAEIVRIKGLQGHESVASWVGVSYKPGGNSVDEWLMCGMHGVIGVGIEAQNAVARNAVARNNVGDCFSDATAWLEDAYKAASNPSKSKTMIARARQEVGGPYGVLSYDGVDAKSKRHLSATLAAIDKAASNPTPENIMAARWESEKGRAHADGGSPRKAFWS